MEKCEKTDPKYKLSGPSTKITTGKSTIHGFGIFAKELIKKGELIEETRLLRYKWRSFYITEPISLDYIWVNNQCNCEICQTHGYVVYLALGYGSLYNHSNSPNTIKKLDFETETLTVTAKEDIAVNDEIFVSYGESYWLYRNLLKKISPLKYDSNKK